MNLTDIRTIKDIMSIYNVNFRKEFGIYEKITIKPSGRLPLC